MNSSSTPIDLSAVRATLRDSVATGIDREDLIYAMRRAGLHQIDCIKMLRDLSGISLGDAKEIVHYSKAWADRKEINEAFHEAVFQAADESGFIETTG